VLLSGRFYSNCGSVEMHRQSTELVSPLCDFQSPCRVPVTTQAGITKHIPPDRPDGLGYRRPEYEEAKDDLIEVTSRRDRAAFQIHYDADFARWAERRRIKAWKRGLLRREAKSGSFSIHSLSPKPLSNDFSRQSRDLSVSPRTA
jgi:hypothetical protein